MGKAKSKISKGVVVEFDFTVLDGSKLLFDTAKALLKKSGVELTPRLEAMHLAGGNYHGGLAELFEKLGKKADAAALARELNAEFNAAVAQAAPGAITQGFRNFCKALIEKDVKVVVATRGDAPALGAAIDDERIALYAETSGTYGNCKWDVWVRACRTNGLHEMLTTAVAGSGFGVKSALLAGMSALGVVNDRVAWQDFGGADNVVGGLDKKAADLVLKMLKVS
jgi:beta-phosphoglucomutase-like phosphatase (HAD superfamily)